MGIDLPGIGGAIKSGVDDIGARAEGAFDSAKESVGEATNRVTDKVADGLSSVGADRIAEGVRDYGEGVSNRLGGDVPERQLGESEDPRELIHGSAPAIQARASHLADFRKAFETVGQGLRGLDSGAWQGKAGDAFREKFGMQPPAWLKAADACEEAGKALKAYGEAVSWAQGQAVAAIEAYKSAERASQSAATAYDAQVAQYNQAATQYNKVAATGGDPGPKPTQPGTFQDPGEAARREAQEILTEARRQRTEAARDAYLRIEQALAQAPQKPGLSDRLGAEAKDHVLSSSMDLAHMVGGFAKGAGGMVVMARTLNPLDPYNLTHPAEWSKQHHVLAMNLLGTVAHPERIPKGVIGSGWSSDRGDAAGGFLSNLIGTKGAGALAKGATRGAARGAGTGAARRGVGSALKDFSRELKCKWFGDPIDMATGRMALAQTDVSLPARLPLVFSRQFESSYQAGRWFGPSWTSTADQRLEIDAEGVIFIRDNGAMLAYPHPAPGVPTLPLEGGRYPLTIDAHGDYTVTDELSGRIWDFAAPGGDGNGIALLAQVIDRSGQWLTFEYDDQGAPTGIVHSAGYHLKIITAEDRITALHLAGAATDGGDQELVRFGYDEHGHLAAVTKSSGTPTRFTNDSLGRITAWTDTNNSSYSYVYDDQARCISQSGEAGYLRNTFTYDGTDPETGNRVITATNSLGHSTRYHVNRDLQVVKEIAPDGATTLTTYDRYDRPLTVTDPLGRTVSYAYDAAGRTLMVVRPDGRYTSVGYNDQGMPVSITGADGTHLLQSFDEFGNRTSVTDASGATTHFAYDQWGHLASITNALGATATVTCNAVGLPLEVTNPLGAVTRYEWDGFGRPVAVTDPLGATIRLYWTVEGKLAQRTAPDGTTESWTYDGEGNCTSHTDGAEAVSSFEYTHFDVMSARTGPDGARYEFEHDTELQLRKVINPQGLSWSYEYDPAGRLVAETDFDDRALTYAHDAAGQLTARTTASGSVIRFERDVLGRTVKKDAAGAVTTYTYDVTGGLARATGPDAVLTLERDDAGRLLSETVNGRTVTYTHDTLGRRTGRTTPMGAVSTWSYDAAGNRTELTTSGRTLTFQHDEAGRELSRHLVGAVTLTSAFDDLGRLTKQELFGPANRCIQQRAYAYRADGNLVGVDDQLNGSSRFDLDAAGRVTAVHAAGWTEAYAYDEAGNQTSASWPAPMLGQEAVGPRTYTGTRIRTAGGVRYEHDTAGRLTLRQKPRLSRKPDTWRYAWDAEDRLIWVLTPDGTTWRYQYDPVGRRIAKQRLAADSSETVVEQVDFTWDGTTLCEQTAWEPGAPQAPALTLTWDHDGLQPLAQTERKTTADAFQKEIDCRFYAIVTDLVGTPTELVDEQGDIAWRTRSTLWGTTAWNRAATAYTPLRFPGQYSDPETGLHYNYYRHYDPETSRYLTPDPLGLAPADNPAAYVHNPHTWTDPLGLSPCGLSASAQRAIEKLNNIMNDPVGAINSQPNHNHYDAARREARGEVVARKSDGTPFDHIADLTQARNGLDKVRRALEDELARLPDGLTERGLDVLIQTRKQVVTELDRLNGFLHQIQHQ
ncbi:putative T7SS-secreted protein [Streptomyces flavidovirens]|uniref:putative T7SS-secreted protein n=1 Tax=Streptomyces flavidovirens TaxID=67298 RepID=UPI0036C3F3AC